MNRIIRATSMEMVSDADPNRKWVIPWIEVVAPGPVDVKPRWQACLPEFSMLCDAVMSDIQSPASAAVVMDWVRKVETEEMKLADVDGNAWIINITRDKVWFEGLYSQGEGGEVSLPQFKLAVQTYCKFLSDPARMPIEVEFPEN